MLCAAAGRDVVRQVGHNAGGSRDYLLNLLRRSVSAFCRFAVGSELARVGHHQSSNGDPRVTSGLGRSETIMLFQAVDVM
jgi:hypothetical protein